MILKKRHRKNKDIYIIILLVVILSLGGYFAFKAWQNQTDIIQTSNANAKSSNASPTNSQIAIKRPTLENGEPSVISIPDRNIEAPIVYITEEQNTADGHQEALANGVVLFPGTALPGELGNPYIFGHSSDYFWKPGDYKEIFKPLIDIPVDTAVRITNPDGELFIYKVIETKIVGPKDVSVMDQYNHERKILTLQTSYPIGTALKRYIAICELDEEATYGPETLIKN
ncbi:sortase [Patescibacteria group bacterium]|nr:sortase [Patescibacteria group bacterium]MBU0963865.1 sortase [Patescibacteria group bacterium]